MKPGAFIGERFLLERLAGAGGGGQVFRARDQRTGATVAVKVAHGLGGEESRRFAREVAVLAELEHPAIVRFVAQGETEDGDPYLVMEWIDGEPLSARLARGPLGVVETLTLGERIAGAVGVAHRRGVVHRDIKPGNVVLAGDAVERAVLIDFGIARRLASGTAHTATGAMVGTLGYMSPEQARGQKDVDARADVFSLGCLLHRAVTGQAAFQGEDALSILLKVVVEEVPRPGELVAGIPPALDELVHRMLAKRPDARPADGAAVAGELAQILAGAARPSTAAAPATPAADPARATLTTVERRVVSMVLRRDAEGAPRPDPGALALASSGEGGELQRIAGGPAIVVFAGHESVPEQAARAVRTALALARLGPAALCVVTGRGELSARVPVGDAIERGVTLLAQAAARVGSVVVDSVTAGLVSGRFDVEAVADLTIVRREVVSNSDRGASPHHVTAYLGRERETAWLGAAFHACVDGRRARAVVVTAPAGVGKSRLARELTRRLLHGGEATVWQARGAALGAGSPFALLSHVVRAALLLPHGEPPAAGRAALVTALEARVPPDEVARLATFLGELVGLPDDDESVELSSARRDPVVMGDQIRRAAEDLLRAAAMRRPVLIVIEDLHAGDLATVLFFERALANLSALPWMVLALARPEVHDRFPDLWGLVPEARLPAAPTPWTVDEMRLGPLGAAACAELVAGRLGARADAGLRALLVELSAGNAFYLEELIRAAAAGQRDALPETVLAMAQARLEAEPPEARRVLRAASVFGQIFWRDAVAALLGAGADVDAELARLVDRDVIERRRGARFQGTEELSFKHALLRDAAYAMLTDADRALAHGLAAEWLEAAGERDALLLVEHLERGGQEARSIVWYRRAVAQAIEGNDFAAAITLSGRGIAAGAGGTERGALRLQQAEAHRWRGEFPEAAAAAERALADLPAPSPLWFMAAAEACHSAGKLGDAGRLRSLSGEIGAFGRAGETSGPFLIAASRVAVEAYFMGERELGDHFLALVEPHLARVLDPTPGVAVRILMARLAGSLLDWNPLRARDICAQAAAVAERAGDLRTACQITSNIATCYLEAGLYEEAEGSLRRALRAAERMGLGNVAASAATNLGYALAHLGHLDDALIFGRRAVAALTGNDQRYAAGARVYLSFTLTLAGDLEEAEAEARRALAALPPVHPVRFSALGQLAAVLLRRGRASIAASLVEEAAAVLERLGSIDEGEAQVSLARAEIAWALGHREEARRVIAAARDRLLALSARLTDPRWRESFLGNVPENARTLACAEAWLSG